MNTDLITVKSRGGVDILVDAMYAFILTFGIGYIIVSRDITQNYGIVVLGVIGKTPYCGLRIGLCIRRSQRFSAADGAGRHGICDPVCRVSDIDKKGVPPSAERHRRNCSELFDRLRPVVRVHHTEDPTFSATCH